MPSPIDSASHVEDSSGTGTPKHMKSSEKVSSSLAEQRTGFVCLSRTWLSLRLHWPDRGLEAVDIYIYIYI